MAFILGILEEAELIFRIWGAKEKYFKGAEEFPFRDLGRSMYYFQGSREHRPPSGPQKSEGAMSGEYTGEEGFQIHIQQSWQLVTCVEHLQ